MGHICEKGLWALKINKKYISETIYLGDYFPPKIVGCSRVLIKFPDGKVKGMNEVLHIMGFTQNLISVKKLNDVSVQVFSRINGVRWFKQLWYLIRVIM